MTSDKYLTQEIKKPYQNDQPPPGKPRGLTGTEGRALAGGLMFLGVTVAIASFITSNTKLVLAYRGGTLTNVHALCSNALVQATGGFGKCSTIGTWYTLATVALYGGLVVSGIGLVILLTQRNAA